MRAFLISEEKKMKTLFMTLVVASGLAFSGGALGADAAAAEALAKKSGCMTCHTAAKKLVGPGFKDIADKYRKDKDAEATLAKRVKAGSTGIWGNLPMPPNAHVKDDDIKIMVQWILSTK
jgi:cytochrome c